MKVLIFSVSIGAGHDLAAQAIAKELVDRLDAQVDIIDTFQYINPALNRVVRGSYMETLKFSPKVWGYLYTQAETPNHFVDLSGILSKLFSPKLEHLVREKHPDVVICTHAFPCGMLSMLKEKRQLNFPLVAVLTDFTVHPFWIYNNVNHYVLPAAELKYYLYPYQVQDKQIWPCGLPIRSEFARPDSAPAAKLRLGLTELPTILIMGGGLGLGAINKLTELVANADIPLQVLTVAGRNKKLYDQLQKLKTSNPLHIYSFVEDIPTLIHAADIVISKPGGLTTAEVLACGKPMMIVAPIPGQEERNTDFLLNNGLAVKARDLSEVLPLLQQLLASPRQIQRIRAVAQEVGNPLAARDLVQNLVDEYDLKP